MLSQQPIFTLYPSPLSFKEWTLTTSLAQWPSEASEVSSTPPPPRVLAVLIYSTTGGTVPRWVDLYRQGQRKGVWLRKRAVGSPRPTLSFSITEMVAECSHLGPRPTNKQKTQQVSLPPPSSLCLCPPQAPGPFACFLIAKPSPFRPFNHLVNKYLLSSLS